MQVIDEVSVAVDVGVEMAELPEQSVGVAGVGFPNLGIEQIVEEKGKTPDVLW